ncbi:MAG: DUF2321 domain-containing protein [FCB group bacterium]|nr:DUF2321 domain-containing protein [FCB group bacterium]
MGEFDVGQVCLNGHAVNGSYRNNPLSNKNHCERCGAKTIIECLNCETAIQGVYRSDIFFGLPNWQPPAYCHNCGEPFPWTESTIEAAQELANEIEELNDGERAMLADSIEDLVKDSPMTKVAATRFNKLMLKVGKDTLLVFRELLIDVISESAKKIVWPNL